MTDKISCPTLNVVLVKAIRALCEVTIKFDHTLEITGSLHIRSDGDKVLTCLLNEDCIKSPASPHLNDIALKLNLVNAALALNNIGVIHSNNNANNSSNSNNNSLTQVTNDSLRSLSLQQNISLKNQNFFSVDAFTSRPLAVLSVSDTNNNNNAASNNPTNILASNVNPFIINQIISPGDNSSNNNVMSTNNSNNNAGKISKNGRTGGGGTRCKKRVDTVARTLANIKNASNDLHQQQQQQALDYNNQIDAPIKLPDIQTLAHRLPSYEVATGDLDTQGQKFKVKSPGAVSMVTLKHSPSSIKKENNGSHQMEDSKLDAKLLNATSQQQQQQQQQKGQNRVKKFQCMFCGIFLSTKCYLKNHVNAMHTRLHVYKCDLCEHSFYSAGAMRIHKLRNHWIDSKKHRCSECNESFLLPIELRKHIQKRHANIANNANVALTTINNNNSNNNNNFINNNGNNNNNSLNANNTIGNNVSINEVAGSSGIKSGFNENSNNISNNGYMSVSGSNNNSNTNNDNNNDGFGFTTAATSINTYSLTADNNNNNNFHKNINDYLAMNAGIINYTTINNNLVEATDFNNNSSMSNNNNMIDHNNISNKKGAVNLTMNSDSQMLNDVEQMKIEPQDQQHDLANKKRILSTSASVTSSLSSSTTLQNFASEINGPS